MNFNKPPFHDPVIHLELPPKPRGNLPGPPNASPTAHTPMSETWENYHALLNNNLNTNLSDFGYIFPSVDTSTLDTNTSKFGQSMVYNESLGRMELNNGSRTTPDTNPPNYAPIQTYGAASTSEINAEAVKDKNLGRIFVNSDTNELQFSVDGATVRTITST